MQILNRLRRRDITADRSSPVKLIVGLGNPGREYAGNRHNIGFHIADRLAAAHDLRFSKIQSKALTAFGHIDGQRVILAKPQTFMNLSGKAVSALLHFYKVPIAQLLVIYDELDLPFGTIRLRANGSAGGHNGMRSIIGQLGSSEFARLRIGIGRPPGRMDPAAFVLQDFSREEAAALPELLDRSVEAIQTFIQDGINIAMNRYNSSAGDKR